MLNCSKRAENQLTLVNILVHFWPNDVCCSSRSAERSEFIISSRAKRAQCVNRVWVLASCKLGALIFTCKYPMVSAMTSYSSLTSRRILFLGNIRLKAISNSINAQSIPEELSFHRLQTETMFTIGESQAISHANRTANTTTPNFQYS